MEIDWSKAPEGTTHFNTGMNSRVDGWMKSENEIWHWWPSTGASIEKKWYPLLNQLRIYTDRFIERPVAWSGEGLPPVGTVCEFAGFNPEETVPTDPSVGDKVTVIAHYLSGCVQIAAFTYNCAANFGSLHVAQGAHGCFRPIRTAEQIAAEERRNAVQQMLVDVSNMGRDVLTFTNAEDLYDAGYRKQAKP